MSKRTRIRQSLERGDTRFEALINRFLDIATILKWPIRGGVIAVAVIVVSGVALPSFRSVPGAVALLGLYVVPELVCVVVGNIHHRFVFHKRVEELDHAAVSAFEGFQASFCVFLRPFEFDGCYFLSVPTISPFKALNRLTFDIEAHLSSMTREIRMPLVALGGSPQHDFRAGRSGRASVSDTEWKARVARALERSKAVFIIPAPHPGTLWELELIASRPDFLGKVMFIMPPRPSQRPLMATTRHEYTAFVEHYETRWGEALALTAQCGLILPGYTQEGAIFVFRVLNASPHVLATLLPMTDEGTDRVLEYLIERAGQEFRDDLLGAG